MNRETLFRGKRVDNDEFAYGDLLHLPNGDVVILSDKGYAKVNPETVGQFTGLTDKNGNKVFEGDIVKEWSSHWKTPLKTEVSIYEVVCEYLGSLHLTRKTVWGETSTPLYRKSIVEVIGNVYDNSELLEAKND